MKLETCLQANKIRSLGFLQEYNDNELFISLLQDLLK